MDVDAHTAFNARGLKLHLRLVPVGATTYRVATLRPATSVRSRGCRPGRSTPSSPIRTSSARSWPST